MANSTSPVPQVVEGTNAVGKINEIFDAASQSMIGGRNAATSALLIFGILGGRINGVDKANSTVTLTASTTNYIVMAKSGLAVSSATSTTNWNDSTNYWRLYSVVTNSTTVTSYNDERLGSSGLFPVAGLSGGGTGDVVGPASSVADRVVTFNGATGKLIKDGGVLLSELAPLASPALTGTATAVNVTFSGLALAAASTAGGAGLRIPHGTPPTSPTNGDVWTTTTGMFARINGATVGPFAPAGGSAAWGAITGTLSAQTDLQAALDLKQNRSPTIQSVTSSATVTPTFSNDMVKVTAQAAALALANPTGTTIDGLGIVIRIKDNGTARAITYGTQYRAVGVTLPVTTVINKTLYLAMIYNSDDTKWDVIAVGQEA